MNSPRRLHWQREVPPATRLGKVVERKPARAATVFLNVKNRQKPSKTVNKPSENRAKTVKNREKPWRERSEAIRGLRRTRSMKGN